MIAAVSTIGTDGAIRAWIELDGEQLGPTFRWRFEAVAAADWLNEVIGGPTTQVDVLLLGIKRLHLLCALEAEGWNMSAAARRVGLTRVGFYKLAKRMDLKRPPHRV